MWKASRRSYTMRYMSPLLLVLLLISSSQVQSQQLRKRISCGDGICQEDENCAICPIDCCGSPQTEDVFVQQDQSRMMQQEVVPRNGMMICSSGPNQALPCATDVDCGLVCSQSPAQVCFLDSQCAGDENVCTDIEGACLLFLLSTNAPSAMPSTSLMPSHEPSGIPTVAPSSSPAPSSVPSASPAPSASLLPTDIPTLSPTFEPTASAAPTVTASNMPSLMPTITGMPSFDQSGAASSSTMPVSFYAIGNVPFSEQDSCLLPYEFDKLKGSVMGGEFLIHLGDIRDTYLTETRPCPETLFTDVASTFSSSPIKSFFLPGERGWLDCPFPDTALGFMEDHLISFDSRTDLGWPEFEAQVSRHPNRTELFSFITNDVLFLGQSLPGEARNASYESKIRESLLKDNYEWTEQVLADNIGDYTAVVIFGNDFMSSVNEGYLDKLVSLVSSPGYDALPVLLLQNGESFRTSITEFADAPNVMWAQTDDTVTPLGITVDQWAVDLEDVFQFDRRCYCTFGHRPTRLKTYLPWDKCAGVCDEAQSQCADVSGCSPGNSC